MDTTKQKQLVEQVRVGVLSHLSILIDNIKVNLEYRMQDMWVLSVRAKRGDNCKEASYTFTDKTAFDRERYGIHVGRMLARGLEDAFEKLPKDTHTDPPKPYKLKTVGDYGSKECGRPSSIYPAW